MKHQEEKLREKITFTIATRKIKYLGISLTKDVKDLYLENYRPLKKEIVEDTNKWKHTLCSWLEELTSLKCAYYLKQFIDSVLSVLRTSLFQLKKVLFHYLFDNDVNLSLLFLLALLLSSVYWII